jgi:hypothetical protein
MEKKIKADDAWLAILSGLASSGELNPETLAQKGGADRVKVLAVHAKGLATVFHKEYTKVNG